MGCYELFTAQKEKPFNESSLTCLGAQSSQTMTIDGSSFESASSFHSLARVEAICEDIPTIEEKPKPSPSHSVSSTSSGSYCMPPMKASSPRHTLPKPVQVTCKKGKRESMSEDERSEKILSSSHDEKEYKTMRVRRSRDWSEDERRRKKGNFKLEFEKDAAKPSQTSPLIRPSGVAKKISPEDKTALNILDGASPSKQHKRFRQKTRKTPRNRTPMAGEEPKIHRSKVPMSKSPEKPSAIAVPIPHPTAPHAVKLSPSKYMKPCLHASPHKLQKKSQVARLKAVSTESLRSVSPGSDSVFYSEADILEHQIHCHHCGKEVEVVTAVADGSEESVVIVDDGPDIVQPPEGFADSPNGLTRTPPALKYYKRFRSEDRRHKKGHNGRAKVNQLLKFNLRDFHKKFFIPNRAKNVELTMPSKRRCAAPVQVLALFQSDHSVTTIMVTTRSREFITEATRWARGCASPTATCGGRTKCRRK